MVALLFELDACLLFDALERSNGHLRLRMGNRYTARFCGMLELLVTSFLCDFKPAILADPLNDLTAVHGTGFSHK
jgi:hypothetical protein